MVYFLYLAKASFGRCTTGKTSLPKIGSKWLGPLYVYQRDR